MKTMLGAFLMVFGLMLSWNTVIAEDLIVVPVKGQFTSWDKKISGSTRFKLVLDGEGVLDRETGLVWEKTPNEEIHTWARSCIECYVKEVGGRLGWRNPTVEELASLVNTLTLISPKLPDGHPFVKVKSDVYWSLTSSRVTPGNAWCVNFKSGSPETYGKGDLHYTWCVRGGYGHDAY